MTSAGRIAVALAIGTVLGCGSSDDSFRLRILWSETDPGCPERAVDVERRCESVPMTCDAKARIRVVDADLPSRAYYTHCFDLPAGGDACKLGELEIEPREIPNTMVKVQVAVWSSDELLGVELADDGCPVSAEFVNGVPKLEHPLPAIGGESYFAVGRDRTAEVRLGCPEVAALECPDTSVTVVATLYDLSVGRQTALDVPRLTVKLGVPVEESDGSYTINQSQLVELTATDGEEPTWRLRLDQRPEGLQCLWVLYQAPQSTAALTCFEADVDEIRGEMRARGFVVKPGDVDDVLKSMDLVTFPASGMVVGLVVDGVNLQVEGAVVASSPESPIHYPSPMFPPVQRDSTSALGMFVSLDAPFESAWTATAPTGAVDDGSARGGLVTEHVSVVLVRLEPP